MVCSQLQERLGELKLVAQHEEEQRRHTIKEDKEVSRLRTLHREQHGTVLRSRQTIDEHTWTYVRIVSSVRSHGLSRHISLKIEEKGNVPSLLSTMMYSVCFVSYSKYFEVQRLQVARLLFCGVG